jgi:hypothetical protein
LRLEYVFAIAATGWAAALPLADFLMSRVHPADPLSVMALLVYAAGRIVCHQRLDRSFHLWSAQMPVCARCTGIYAGAAIAAATLLIRTRARAGFMSPILPDADTVRRILAAAALPTLATLILEWTTWMMPSNTVRALAGIPLGAAVAWVIGAAVAPTGSGSSLLKRQQPEVSSGKSQVRTPNPAKP